MINAHLKVILRTDYTKIDGTNPIWLRVTINRKVKFFSLNISVNKIDWNKKGFVVKSHPKSEIYNLDIKNALNKANSIIYDYSLSNKVLTFSDFKTHFVKNDINSGSFYSFIENQIKKYTGIFSKSTIKAHNDHLSKLKKFKYDIKFDEINLELIESYKKYMITELKNNSNTVSKCLAFFKAQINKAIKEGYLTENPFKNLPIKSIKGDREYLSLNEVKILESLDVSKLNKPQKSVLKYFLFACYTGLRFQDIKNLKHKHIEDNFIRIIMHKTNQLVKIPLIEKANNLIVKNEPEHYVFRVFTNQVTNRYLKEIMTEAQIKKIISFHCARHTFATIGIEVGIPIEIISGMLGHSDLKTTSIYSKIMDYKKEEYMKRWNDFKKI